LKLKKTLKQERKRSIGSTVHKNNSSDNCHFSHLVKLVFSYLETLHKQTGRCYQRNIVKTTSYQLTQNHYDT